MNSQPIVAWCSTGSLPGGDELYTTLLREDGLFDDSEGSQWDFKENWPFSLSDDYFGGIARLVCAFANSHGGIIVFGVHDKKRTGGHNKVKWNIDRFNAAINQLIGTLPQMTMKSYQNEFSGDVDVLLVKSRQSGVPPLRFKKQVGKYRAGTIWVRAGHEVRAAEPSHYPVLFCRAQPANLESSALDGSIPPSPATLKQRFVGRTEVLDHLFQWLEASDEPRTFLHGKGGSGKTTIAYELARLVKEHGENLRAYGGERLDAVIFVSAKEKSLLVAEARVVDTETRDFSNEKELLSSILHYGGWTIDEDYLAEATVDQLRTDVKEYLNINSVLLVIDDIDTLTTKGIDPGSDFLYRTLCRAARHSKVLYTLRNAPSQSLINAVEVPGLSDDDYELFVDECVEHFRVQQPTLEFRKKKLSDLSERRPLVIESVIALRRTAGSYDHAIDLFQQQTGDAIRDYVFLREWDALPANTSRLLLAALSEFNEPAGFRDLQSVLQYDPSTVNDAIGAVREMFLQIDEAGSDALYALAPLTKAFVKSKRSQLVGYGLLHERVKAFRRHVAVSNPRVANIATQVDRLIPTRFQTHQVERLNDAYRLVTDKNLPPFVTEDPFFRTVLGYVCASFAQSRLQQARGAFEYSFNMNFEPDFRYLRAWFQAERGSGINDGWCLKIADYVLHGKRYEERDKMEMIGRKATSLYARAQERLVTDPSDALKDLAEALRLHLRAYRLYCIAGDSRAENSERYARSTGFQLLNTLGRSSVPWEFLEIVETLGRAGDGYLDPLEDPIFEAAAHVIKTPLKAEAISRTRQRVRLAIDSLSTDRHWLSKSVQERTSTGLRQFDRDLEAKLKLLRQPTRASM
ncbi:AAA family ATPase [Rhizobiales bacterium RZME27]|uniref:AAA family ATPase n=1 Tax=Endobacterium cereale TaxID=2663029 RepID=A0A6A8ALQ7_9HYPH|nr:RNA-binding domain-containing protein [Endobacterium cereale]MQY50086.1 AAA family ATPase [Endobacterium cereale]